MNQIAQHLLLLALAILYSYTVVLSQFNIYNNRFQRVFTQVFDKRFLPAPAYFFDLLNITLVNPYSIIMNIAKINKDASVHQLKMNEMTYINLLKTRNERNDIII
ncbi:hypothetical protein GALL_178340 [mine drainage metagenome]|uniref:Uncharacterized protein n=1 Tax=mine drainage metagenome TaxID=410659 RepID=A0A1J5SEN9_9ZZZZ